MTDKKIQEIRERADAVKDWMPGEGGRAFLELRDKMQRNAVPDINYLLAENDRKDTIIAEVVKIVEAKTHEMKTMRDSMIATDRKAGLAYLERQIKERDAWLRKVQDE